MIQAWQHIYTNVEKEQSPRGLGGFQTLAASPELDATEVAEMEGRLLYVPAQMEPVKRLFFTTAQGHVMVGQAVPLADPDQYGRKGRYLAHSLVFEPEAFKAGGADPFRVLETFPFITNVADALAHCGASDTLPPVEFDLSPAPVFDMAGWPISELQQLALLALRAEQMSLDRLAVALVGESAEIEEALRLAMLAVPTQRRTWCTFDTYFYHCNLVATYYWAVGLPERPGNANFLLVDAAARRVLDNPADGANTIYERWVLAGIAAGTWLQDIAHRDAVYTYAEWLDGRLPEGASEPELLPALLAAVQACCPHEAHRASVPAATAPEDWPMPEPKRGGLLKKFGDLFGRK